MSTNLTKKQQSLFVHFSNKENDKVTLALKHFLWEMNFYYGDLYRIFIYLKTSVFYEHFSILFKNIGPFGTFQQFKTFFKNVSVRDLLGCTVEEFPGDRVELTYSVFTMEEIEDVVSKINITPSISLCELFFELIPTDGGILQSTTLYQDPSLAMFAGGKDNKPIRAFIEQSFRESGVEIKKKPESVFIFPTDWITKSFKLFINILCFGFGFSEIEYVKSSSSSLKSIRQAPTNPVFGRLVDFFKDKKSFNILTLNLASFYKEVCGVSMDAFIQSRKDQFNLFLRFLFTIDANVATPHPRFNQHVEHFVLAFMRVIGASLDGIQVQAVIKSGLPRINDETKQFIVCSSVATGRSCRKQDCQFLHTNTPDYGIVSTHKGNVIILCLPQQFDKKPPKKSIFNEKLFRSELITVEPNAVAGGGEGSFGPEPHAVARGGSFGPEPHAVARGGSFGPEPLAVARGGSFGPEPLAVARGGSFGPEPLAVAGGGSAKPEPLAVAREGSAKPEPLAVAREGSAKPELCTVSRGFSFGPEPLAVASGGSAKPELCAVASGGDEDYDPNDPQLKKLFSLYPLDNGVDGTISDRMMAIFHNLSSDNDDMALLAALVVRDMVGK
jgi:hypothetical protein